MAAAEGQRAAGWSLRGRLLALIVAVSCGVISLGAAFNKLIADFNNTAPAAKSESFYGAKP